MDFLHKLSNGEMQNKIQKSGKWISPRKWLISYGSKSSIKILYQITCGNGIGEGVLLHSIPIFPGKRNTNSAQVLLCKKWKLKKEESWLHCMERWNMRCFNRTDKNWLLFYIRVVWVEILHGKSNSHSSVTSVKI